MRFYRRCLLGALMGIVAMFMGIGLWCHIESGRLSDNMEQQRHYKYVKVREDGQVIEGRPAELMPDKEYNWDDGVATDEQLRGAACVSYKGKSGIKYTFGVKGSNVYDSFKEYPDDEAVLVPLNPMAETDREVGFYFRYRYGHGTVLGGEAEDVESNVKCLMQMNRYSCSNPRFINNDRPGLVYFLYRSKYLYYKYDSWDIDVITVDMDTCQVLDSFVLDLEEVDNEGNIIDIADTSMSGWWILTGAHSMTLNDSEPFGPAAVNEKYMIKSVVSQYEESNEVCLIGDNGGVEYIDVREDVVEPDSWIITSAAEGDYCISMLKYDKLSKSFRVVESKPDFLYALTPVYTPQQLVGLNSRLFTLYAYSYQSKDGEVMYRYCGFTDFCDERCIKVGD